jgi:hypothetical protein
LLSGLGQRADKFAIVRSLFHNRNEHSGGTGRMLSVDCHGRPNVANARRPSDALAPLTFVGHNPPVPSRGYSFRPR